MKHRVQIEHRPPEFYIGCDDFCVTTGTMYRSPAGKRFRMTQIYDTVYISFFVKNAVLIVIRIAAVKLTLIITTGSPPTGSRGNLSF